MTKRLPSPPMTRGDVYRAIDQVASTTQMSKSFCEKLRYRGGGSDYFKAGGLVRYHTQDVRDFMRARARSSLLNVCLQESACEESACLKGSS